MTAHSLLVLSLAVFLALASGCGGPAPNENSASVASTKPNEVTPIQNGAPEASSAESISVAAQAATAPDASQMTVTSESAPSVEPAAGDNGAEPTAGAPATAVVANAMTTPESTNTAPVESPPKVQPNQEQLALWAQSNYERFELLAIHDPKSPVGLGQIAAIDENRYLIAGTQLAIRPVQTVTPEKVLVERADENRVITALAVASDGDWFVVGSKDGNVAVIDLKEGQKPRTKRIYQSSVVHLAISPNGQELATISFDGVVSVRSVETLEEKRQVKLDTHGVTRLQYVGPTTLVAAGESMSAWDTATGKALTKYPSRRFHSTMSLSKDGQWFIFSADQGLQVWDVVADKPLQLVEGEFASNEVVAISTDRRWLATVNGSTVRIWDLQSGDLCQWIDNTGYSPVGLDWLGDSGLIVVASEMGRCRIWGTVQAASKRGMQPLHTNIVSAEETIASPASSAQLLATIDLRLFPKYPGYKDNFDEISSCNYSVNAAHDDVKTFYRYHLDKAGWQETVDAAAPHALTFQKHGMTLSVAIYAGGPGEASVNLSLLGPTDLQTLPRLKEFKPTEVYAGPSTVMLKAKGTLPELEASILRSMTQDKWTLIAPLGEVDDDSNTRQLRFLKNAEVVSFNLSKDQAEPGTFVVQSSREHTPFSLPLPEDCEVAEWDDHLGPRLVTTTNLPIQKVVAFFDEAMVRHGFIARELGRSIKDDRSYLSFVREEQDVAIGLTTLDSGVTQIAIGTDLSDSWQLQKVEPEEDLEADKSEAEGDEGVLAYSSWLRKHRYPATIALLDKWIAEVKSAEAKSPVREPN